MEGSLGNGEIVEGLERCRIGWRVRVDSAQQQPGQQREQQDDRESSPQELHGCPVAAGDPPLAARIG